MGAGRVGGAPFSAQGKPSGFGGDALVQHGEATLVPGGVRRRDVAGCVEACHLRLKKLSRKPEWKGRGVDTKVASARLAGDGDAEWRKTAHLKRDNLTDA